MNLSDILLRVLTELNMPKPEDAYEFDDIQVKDLGYGIYYKYIYTNSIGQEMEITNMVSKNPKDPERSIYIAFAKHDPKEPDEEEYDSDEEQEKKYAEKMGAIYVLIIMHALFCRQKTQRIQRELVSLVLLPKK